MSKGLRLIEKRLDELANNHDLDKFNRQMTIISVNLNCKVGKGERRLAMKLKELTKINKFKANLRRF